MSALINEDLVRLDADLGSDKHDVIRAMARIVADAGRAVDVDQLADDALAREATAATGLNGGIAIPHCRSAGVEIPPPDVRAHADATDFDSVGDLLFAAVALARERKVDPELALRSAADRFRERIEQEESTASE